MKTTFLLWGALVLLSPKGLAQGGSATVVPSNPSAQKALSSGVFDALHREFVQAKVDFSAQLAELQKSDAYREARKNRDLKTLRALIARIPKAEDKILPRFLKAAATVKGTPEEAKLLFYLLTKSGRNRALSNSAFKALKARHAKSKGWGPVLRILPWVLPKDETIEFFSRLAKESPHPEVRIMAQYVAASTIRRDKKASPDAKKAAAKVLDEIKSQHPESLPGLSMNGNQFIKEHLQIGMKAPDIIGKDVYGKPMKLSDFLGRVVVIDFWGDW